MLLVVRCFLSSVAIVVLVNLFKNRGRTMEVSQKIHADFHEVHIVDSCMNLWACYVFLSKVCLILEVTKL